MIRLTLVLGLIRRL
ncbi:hypothetical protein HU200_056647 [Digitaria exilis]|uniref:Uncharacterized protein n=1 Tax=Digitaria exilis TaxID=1010633 RepID=A0A835AG12_9POAL|nr:hypothetical protein HU200_056647 [Digitaria exilis]